MATTVGGGKGLASSRASAPARRRPQASAGRHASRNELPHIEGPEWELVLRIAASRRFQRSALLTNFLLYVCRQALTGQQETINEHQIGVHVFGRGEQFNRSDDNIVRNYARMLRGRIEDYFAHEGRDEPTRLHIPRGGYLPVFTAAPSPAATPSVDDVPAEEEGQSEPSLSPPSAARPRALLGGRKLLILGLVLGFVVGIAQPWRWLALLSPTTRLNHRFWRSILRPDQDTVVVPSDGGLVILHRFLEHPTNLSDYLNGSYRKTEAISSGLQELLRPVDPSELPMLSHKVEMLGDRRYTSMVDLDIASRISRLTAVVPERLTIRYARELRMDELKHSNVILIGSVDANPWVELFQPQLNFQFEPGGSFGGSAVIVNRRPLAGEAKTYASITGDPTQRTYGVIAYLPNVEGNGRVLIVEGINMAGTQGAGEFLLNPEQMAQVLRRAQKPTGELRPFEILLETTSVGANSSQLHVLSERVSPS